MNVLLSMLAAVLAVVSGLDNYWTTGMSPEQPVTQVLNRQEPANAGSCVTEGKGFEPMNAFASPVFKTGAINRSATPPSFILTADRNTDSTVLG